MTLQRAWCERISASHNQFLGVRSLKSGSSHTKSRLTAERQSRKAWKANKIGRFKTLSTVCALCWVSHSGTAYLYVEWNADEDIPTYGDDDSQEISLWKQTVNRHKMRWCSTCHATFPNSSSHLQAFPPAAASVIAMTAKEKKAMFRGYSVWWH